MPLTFTRTIAVTVALGASVGLAACGGSSASTANTSTTTTQSTVTTTTTSAPPSPAAAAALKSALAAYASCMRRNGVNIPPPRTNAHGQPVLSTAGVNTSSKHFFTAFGKCRTFVQKLYALPHS